jgi:ankyrin repeat protein
MPLILFIFDEGVGFRSREALADVALAYGADINAGRGGGWTALMETADYGNPKYVAYLLRHGANPNLEDEEGDTPLLVASDRLDSHGWPLSISGLLLAAHADPCHKNHKGETPATHFGLNTPLGRMLDEMCRGTPASPSAHP